MLRRRRLRPDDPLIYELVELRRQQWDLMIWQVPVLTLTGQAFLFTIILGGTTEPWARVLAGMMSVGVSFLAMLLLARQRQSEQADAEWLEQQEALWDDRDAQHGRGWTKRRDAQLPGYSTSEAEARRVLRKRNRGWGFVALLPAYKTWVIAHWSLIVFAIMSVLIALAFDYDWFSLILPTSSITPDPTVSPTP